MVRGYATTQYVGKVVIAVAVLDGRTGDGILTRRYVGVRRRQVDTVSDDAAREVMDRGAGPQHPRPRDRSGAGDRVRARDDRRRAALALPAHGLRGVEDRLLRRHREVLEHRRERHRHIHGADAPDRRVQEIERPSAITDAISAVTP